jgi:hypothetical protein
MGKVFVYNYVPPFGTCVQPLSPMIGRLFKAKTRLKEDE